MQSHHISLPNSIGVQLLKNIFGVYCIAAICVFSTQSWLEYVTAEKRVLQTMVSHKEFVAEGLANAVWHLDIPLLESLIEGVLSQSTITGMGVYDETGHLIISSGKTEHYKTMIPTGKSAGGLGQGLSNSSQHHELHFELFDPNGLSVEPIGMAIFYTDKDVVVSAVKPTVISLMVAAVIKTLILWVVFIYFGRKLLSKPIKRLISLVKDLSVSLDDKGTFESNHNLNELHLFENVVLDMEKKLNAAMSELRTSNEKLSKTNYQLLTAAEQSPTLSILLSLNKHVAYTTSSITELTGYGRDQAQEFFDKYLLSVLPPDDGWIISCGDGCDHTGCSRWSGDIEVQHKKEGYVVYLHVTFLPLCSESKEVTSILCTVNDISVQKRLERALKQKNSEQSQMIKNLELTQRQLVQAEKMASVGQLAAGVAHEINNPIGFVASNMRALRENFNNLLGLIDIYDGELNKLKANKSEIETAKQNYDFEYICEDTPELLDDNNEGLERIKRIVSDLMGFSYQGDSEFVLNDLREALDSTLNVAWHELKYKAAIIKEYGEIPEIECIPSQLNQVFINLMVNAVHAMKEKGAITLRTYCKDAYVTVEIEDTGSGIDPVNLSKLFDPFFTTKPVGQGTGLGLSVSYGIIQAHHGNIVVDSRVGEGTCFKISLPIKQPVVTNDEPSKNSLAITES